MNQKGLATVVLLLTLFGIVVVVSCVYYFKVIKNPEEIVPTEQSRNSQPVELPSTKVVRTFCDNFFKGPPAINEQGVVIALGLLSQKARDSIVDPGPSPSGTLVKFLGVYDVPENGYTIDEISEGLEKATIKTTWKYSSGAIVKTFELGKENGSWKINSIQ